MKAKNRKEFFKLIKYIDRVSFVAILLCLGLWGCKDQTRNPNIINQSNGIIIQSKESILPLSDYMAKNYAKSHETKKVVSGSSNFLLLEYYSSGRYKEIELLKERENNIYIQLDKISLFGEEGNYLSTYPIQYEFIYHQFYSPPTVMKDFPCNYFYKEQIEILDEQFKATAKGNLSDLLNCFDSFCSTTEISPLVKGIDSGERKYILNILSDAFQLSQNLDRVKQIYFNSSCKFSDKESLWIEIENHLSRKHF